MTRPQVILAGLDFGRLTDDQLWALNLRLSAEYLTALRILAGWDDVQILAAGGDPDVDADQLVLIRAKLKMTDIMLSRRTGTRIRSAA